MIISNNSIPSYDEFKELMNNVDQFLNRDAKNREAYYSNRNGSKLEQDVADAMRECAKGTPFENSIVLVSGHKFPDIITNNYYGVEVKSSKDGWESIGSSIMEGTRVDGIERIFMTFGKLNPPISFLSRPYEECLCDIAVTHSPRYKINMLLGPGETVFDKIGIPYDKLRKMEEPVKPVAEYYRNKLKPGEALWWAPEQSPDQAVSATIRIWRNLNTDEKKQYLEKAYALFPEITDSKSSMKYVELGLWFITQGIYIPNVRDLFSAGGQIHYVISGEDICLPATFKRIIDYKDGIAAVLLSINTDSLKQYWHVDTIDDNPILQWCKIVSSYNVPEDKKNHLVSHALDVIFRDYL